MKPIKFLLLCLLLLGYTACKQSPKRYTIGVSQCSTDEWRDKMNTEMISEAASLQNVDLIFRSANDNTEKQIEDIQYFVNQKVDLLIITPNKTAPITPVIEALQRAGIPVVLVDRKILSDKYTAFIGADNYQIGQQVGTYLARLLNGKGNVVEILGLDGSSSALERHQGFADIVGQYPAIKIIYQGDGAWLQDGGENQMRKALNVAEVANVSIDAVFAQNDRMAKGAYSIAQEHKLAQLKFIGIDALPGPEEGIDWVLQNKLHATFIYPTGGDKVIELAMAILDGKPFNKNNTLTSAVVDQSNAKVLKLQTDQISDLQIKINSLNQRVDTYLGQYLTQRYIIYAITTIGIIFLIILLILYKANKLTHRLNNQLSISNKEINEQKIIVETQRDQLIQLSEQLTEATQAKLNFFTNISHEFRTPLTLIAGPIDYLQSQSCIQDSREQEKQVHLLHLVQRNVKILLRLVDQILDFRSIEVGQESINYTTVDFISLLKNWNESFSNNFTDPTKDKKFTFTVDTNQSLIGDFDIDKLERIYLNLLSNAFKYTPDDGHIGVTVDWDGINHQVCLNVTNTGTLTDEQIAKIFDRFYRIDSKIQGSGIGLSLVKAMVQLHGGNIHATSQNNCITITVKLPLQADQITNQGLDEPMSYADWQSDADQPEPIVLENRNIIHLLIIDDNADVRTYIKTILTNTYNTYVILEASDGEQGFQIAMHEDVDIIISDIMMPKRDGISLCRLLKNTQSTSHIPVILLTACSLEEQRVLGFESGADAYISKPFNVQILEIRIRKMIENRNHLAYYFKYNTTSELVEVKISNIDQSLVNKLKEFILANISNSEINVEDLSRSFALSRTQFYRKIKAITSLSPNEFIRSVRLQEAYKLLQANKNIAEVAYEVGFTSPSYFTKCFKEYFDKNPSDIKEKS